MKIPTWILDLYTRYLFWGMRRRLVRQCCCLLDQTRDEAMMNLTRWRWELEALDIPEDFKDAIARIFDRVAEMIEAIHQARIEESCDQ